MDRKKSFAALIWVVFTDSFGWGIAFSVFAALFFNEHSTILPALSSSSRYFLYEFLLAIYSFFMFFFAPVLGGIADRYGRKPGLEISIIGLTFGFVLSALGCYFSLLSLLIIGRIISGITAGSLSIAQAAVIDISQPNNKSFNLSIVMLANCLGFSLGPVLGGILINIPGAPTGTITFLVGALMSLIGFVGIRAFFKESYLPETTKEKLNILKDFINIKIVFCKPILNIYLLTILFSMLGFGLFYSNIPVFLSREFNASNSTTGLILSLGAVIFSAALMFSGKYILTFFSKKKVVIVTLYSQLLIYFVLSLGVNSLSVNIFLFMLISAFAGVMYIGILTLISDETASDWQGRVMGVVASLSSVTWGVGPLLSGTLNHYATQIAFLCCALLITLSIVILKGVKKRASNPDLIDAK